MGPITMIGNEGCAFIFGICLVAGRFERKKMGRKDIRKENGEENLGKFSLVWLP